MTSAGVRGVAGVVLFPGSGSSAGHPGLVAIEGALAPLPVRRVDFPYRRAGRAFPDRAGVLVGCVREEVTAFAAELGVPTSRLVIGGRSMGGRMCSLAAAGEHLGAPLEVAGLVLVSYPLHPPGRPERPRTDHLGRIGVSVLCVSGTRDTFGTPAEISSAFALVRGAVRTHLIEGKGHDLKGCDDEVARAVSRWVRARRPRG